MNNNIIHFGVDHLKLNFSEDFSSKLFEYFFKGLCANSNYKDIIWHKNIFLAVFSSTQQKHILNISYQEKPVMCLEKITDPGIGRYFSYVLKFHSTYFKFPELNSILQDLILWTDSTQVSVSRLDICLDVDVSIEKLREVGFKSQFKKDLKIKNGKNIETWYLGSKSHTNKKHFIRVYNKLLDSSRKSKFDLYQDYFAYDNVTRIEVQINSQSCRSFGVNLNNIYDADFLKKVFKSCCINASGTRFDLLDSEAFEKLDIIRRKPPTKSEILDKLKYARVMLGYAKNLKRAGFDPVRYLVEKFYIV